MIEISKNLEDVNVVAIIGAFIAMVFTLIAFLLGFTFSFIIVIFLFFFILSSLCIILANRAYCGLKDWNKRKEKYKKEQ